LDILLIEVQMVSRPNKWSYIL